MTTSDDKKQKEDAGFKTSFKLNSKQLNRLHKIRAWMITFEQADVRASLEDTLETLMDFYEANKMAPAAAGH